MTTSAIRESRMFANDRSLLMRRMLQQVAPGAELEKLSESLEAGHGDESASLESLDAGRPLGSDGQEFALETLDVLIRNGIDSPLDDDQMESLEAIVLPRFRPVVNIVNGTFATLPDPWEHLGTGLAKQRIEDAIKSIGRIEVPRHPRLIPYAGTGFIVGKAPDGGHLLMTNRHVADLFATGLGQRNLAFHPGQQVAVDFKRELVPTPPELLAVEAVVMIHPYWDMALLRVTGLPGDFPVLSLSTTNPAEMQDHDVAVIGYPAQDFRNDLALQSRVFGGIFEVKRLQPGKLRQREEFESYGRSVNAVTHDSSTLCGNSGSAVIEFSDPVAEASSRVVGLHFAGEYLKANYAVPTWELAQDSRIVDTGVNFVGRVDPRGDFYGPIWHRAEGDETAATAGKQAVSKDVTAPLPVAGVTPRVSVVATSSNWMIPINVSISVGNPEPAAIAAAAIPATTLAQPSEGLFGRREPTVALERFSIDSLLATEFSWPTALSLALACDLAYGSRAAIENTARNVWQLQSCEFIEADDTQCLVASTDRVALVAFRGTESVGDWLADLNVLSTDRPYGTVHRGFRSAFAVVEVQLRAALSGQKDKPLLITGHSLGGGLAMIAAAEWRNQAPIAWVYTYGQPRVGRANFAAFMSQNYPRQLIRVVNDDDIVTRVPPTYSHLGQLLHFDSSGHLQRRTESLAATVDPPALTEAEFDELRASLLAERSRRRAAGASESLAGSGVEGVFPSFRDHSLARYIAKIAAQVET